MKNKTKKEEDLYDDDDCEVCRLMRMKGDNVTEEELVKAMSLQNFLNSFPEDKNKKNQK